MQIGAIKRYNISDIWVAKIKDSGQEFTIFVHKGENSYYYSNILSGLLHSDREIKIVDSFSNYVKKNGCSILLRNSQAIHPDQVKSIIKLIKKKKQIEPKEIESIKEKSYTLACIVSDLLGLNVAIKPSSNLNFEDLNEIQNVLIPGNKLEKLKKDLSKQFEISLYEVYDTDLNIIIPCNPNGMDYRVKNALKKLKIDDSKAKNNHFSVRANKEHILVQNRFGEYVPYESTKTLKLNRHF